MLLAFGVLEIKCLGEQFGKLLGAVTGGRQCGAGRRSIRGEHTRDDSGPDQLVGGALRMSQGGPFLRVVSGRSGALIRGRRRLTAGVDLGPQLLDLCS